MENGILQNLDIELIIRYQFDIRPYFESFQRTTTFALFWYQR